MAVETGAPHLSAATMNSSIADADGTVAPREITQAEIDDILGNPSLSIEERQAALRELSDQVGLREPAGNGEEALSPFGLQISEALNMLAEGGHRYSRDGLVDDKRPS